MPISIDSIIEKIEWSAQRGLSEFVLKSSGSLIRIRRDSSALLSPAPQSSEPEAARFAQNIQEEIAGTVSAPMAGICYLKPENDGSLFVSIGDAVDHGQTICIIEAMKVMTSITATVAGTIESIFVEDGTSVDAGTPLVKIRA